MKLRDSMWLSKAGLSLPELWEKRRNCSPIVGNRDKAPSVTQLGCPSSPSTQVCPAEHFQGLALRNKKKMADP